MIRREVTFREITYKTIEIVGKTEDDIARQIEDAIEEPERYIDFEKNPDDYVVDYTHIGPVERSSK